MTLFESSINKLAIETIANLKEAVALIEAHWPRLLDDPNQIKLKDQIKTARKIIDLCQRGRDNFDAISSSSCINLERERRAEKDRADFDEYPPMFVRKREW